MVIQLDNKLKTKLSEFNQRPLNDPEIFLLAKAIADELPLPDPDTENIKIFIISHTRLIEEVVYLLNNYTFINEEQLEAIKRIVTQLTYWRYKVAYNPPRIIFRDSEMTVIDDISALPRFVDLSYMCSVADIVDNANYLYNLFRDVVFEVKCNIIET